MIMSARLDWVALLASKVTLRPIRTKTCAGVQREVDVKNRYSAYQITDTANESSCPEQRARSVVNVIQFIDNEILIRQHHHHEQHIVTHSVGQVVAERLERVE